MVIILSLAFALLLLIPSSACASGNDKGDSLQVSLLTCSPGEELYTMFGHSGIRVRNISTGEDVVFNYGMFNYDADNFAYRFVKGETDYELGAEYANGFFARYERKGHSVVEQSLNLTTEQKQRLVVLLFENYQPENRVYRYNFLYDNCTTRARDVIERAVADCGDSVAYAEYDDEVTFRNILHEFTHSYPWAEFGIDMLLGEEVDKLASHRKSMFIPSYFENEVDKAFICSKGIGVGEATLLIRKDVVESDNAVVEDGVFPTPKVVFFSMFVLSLILCVLDYWRKKISWWWDAFLLTCQGLAGVIVAFLYFFSEHPAVGSNWLVIIFNPLPLVCLYWIVKSRKSCHKCWLSSANLAILFLFTVSIPFIPQSLNPAMIPLVLTLLSRAISGEIVVRRVNKEICGAV